ncbi:ABC transporter permease [Fulvivirgaceae bacterium PWU5]|uniref:ABC transporter permease n=1 Tax=Dawidia cretensis TaxID=2782350 RepID=A0AAP2GU63_9BACT|nr:ABC transporter permease [Dawidia cretensis]MBT1708420.1 ABC transporter permease [Dawidia cretensis]
MYKSYIRIGWRNLLKNKAYSLINIGGLAAGMAMAILIGLWIQDEMAFNTYYKNYHSIARVMQNYTLNGETFTSAALPSALRNELKNNYSDNFTHVVMALSAGNRILSAGEKNLSMLGEVIEAVGPEMFSLNMLQGSRFGLRDPHSVLLSQSAAMALFGSDDPMNKSLRIDNRIDVKVAGVYEDLPHNTHFHGVKFFQPWELFVSENAWVHQPSFTDNFASLYVAIADRTSFEAVSGKIRNSILDNIRGHANSASTPQVFLHPVAQWHLRSEFKNGVNTGGLIQTVRLFGIVGVFVLMLACINFMNLSTARSEKRAKEVGIRKSAGSARTQLMSQFFIESFLVVLLAFMLALVVASFSLNWFNTLAGKHIGMPWTNVYFWLCSMAFVFITGMLAGSYPAFYLSSFNPVHVLKGTLRIGRFASLPRKVLVVIQFTVSVILIIGTIIVYRQIQFAKDRPVGYDKSGLIMIPMTTPDFQGKYDVFRTELKNTGAVMEIAESSSPPTDIWNKNGGFDWNGKDPAFAPEWATLTVTPEYGKTVGWQFVKGRDFSRDIASDSAAFIINEAAAKMLGFENPVGEIIRWQSGWRSRYASFTVLGVIKDMVMKSPYDPSSPAVYFLSPYGTNWINVRINPEMSLGEVLPKIESVFKKIVPTAPFDYKFADHEYASKFAAEERIGKLASVFGALAILISCLGLFGLASFVAEQRTKEIGIRKVVGASVFSLWKMLSKDFVVLVIISCVIAIPAAYYLLAAWLQKFEYRTEISWWIFSATMIVALVITLLTVSYQAIKAALINPVKSLRSE